MIHTVWMLTSMSKKKWFNNKWFNGDLALVNALKDQKTDYIFAAVRTFAGRRNLFRLFIAYSMAAWNKSCPFSIDWDCIKAYLTLFCFFQLFNFGFQCSFLIVFQFKFWLKDWYFWNCFVSSFCFCFDLKINRWKFIFESLSSTTCW